MGFWFGMLSLIVGLVLYALWSGKAGMQREYRDRQQGLSDLLRYATPVADGVMLGKGGELMAGFFYRGADTESASNAELEAIAARLNGVKTRLGSGWMVHIDAIRASAIGYAPEGDFLAMPVAQLIDLERRQQYNREGQEGGHFESIYAMVFTYLPPLQLETKARSMMFERSSDLARGNATLHEELVEKFQLEMRELEGQLGSIFDGIARMRCHEVRSEADDSTVIVDDLYGYLHYCVTGITQKIIRPPVGTYADAIIGSQDFTGGNHPKIGAKHIRVVAIDGFPSASFPGVLSALNTLPIAYRWSTRFIFLEPDEGKSLLDSLRKKWKQKVRGMKDQMMGTQSGAVDEDALEMMGDAQVAMSEATSGLVRFGHYTSVVVLMADDVRQLDDGVQECTKLIRNLGFAARVETINAVEAYLGSLPGHGYENVRRPIMHTLNLVHLIPTTATWPGLDHNPCPFYPPKSAPLLYAATTGNAPFRISLHVGDVGHTMIAGPTGAGKSTLLELLEAQHLRYPRAKLFKFEKGYSSYVLCNALGGAYYDIGGEHQDLAFCPLGRVDKPAERFWAEGYIETLLELQGIKVQPHHRNAIRDALVLLARSEPDRRSMTEFASAVQNHEIQAALQPYTLAGNNAMLDAVQDNVAFSRVQVFEMEHLMGMGDRYAVPVLLYLFRCVERQLDGSPVLLVLDEAWLLLQHPLFQEKIREWLKVLRKANCAVVFATQSISDVGKSAIRDVLYESCPTKILLPNPEARSNQASIELYKIMGLNDRQIEMLAMATPKRDYYYMSPLGKRMFRLGLGPVSLAFVGASGKEDVATARHMVGTYGRRWPVEWLKHCAATKPWGKDLPPAVGMLERLMREAA